LTVADSSERTSPLIWITGLVKVGSRKRARGTKEGRLGHSCAECGNGGGRRHPPRGGYRSPRGTRLEGGKGKEGHKVSTRAECRRHRRGLTMKTLLSGPIKECPACGGVGSMCHFEIREKKRGGGFAPASGSGDASCPVWSRGGYERRQQTRSLN